MRAGCLSPQCGGSFPSRGGYWGCTFFISRVEAARAPAHGPIHSQGLTLIHRRTTAGPTPGIVQFTQLELPGFIANSWPPPSANRKAAVSTATGPRRSVGPDVGAGAGTGEALFLVRVCGNRRWVACWCRFYELWCFVFAVELGHLRLIFVLAIC